MALTWNGFLDSTLCPEVCRAASSQTSQEYTINQANTWKTENFWKNGHGTRQNGALMYSWYSGVELSIPRFDRHFLEVQLNSLQRSVTNAGNQRQGWGGAHLREVRTLAWDTREISKSTTSPPPHPLLLPFQEAHPQNAIALCQDKWQRSSWHRGHAGTTAGADPNLPQPRAVFQPQYHLVLCCPGMVPPAQPACTCCKSTLQVHNSRGWSQKSEQTFAKTLYHGIGFATPHGQTWLFPSSINTKTLPFFSRDFC